jgi:hypothetical protein
LATAFQLRAQALLFVSPNPVEETFRADLTDEELSLELFADVKNLSGDTLRLKWLRHEISKPDVWRTQVCDPNFCYLPGVSTNYNPVVNFREPVVIAPGATVKIGLYLLPGGMPGSGSFHLFLSTIAAPDKIIETIELRADVQSMTTSFASPSTTPQVRIYPNPATEYIELSHSAGIDQLVFHNLLGRVVRQLPVAAGRRYDLSGMPDGMYLVRLVSRRDGILRTLRLSKRSLRP